MHVFLFPALIGAVLLTGCEAAPVERIAGQPRALPASDLRLAQDAITYNFRDPGAAQFRGLSGYVLSTGDRVVCGEVNGKNAFGAYVGFQPFYVRLSGGAVAAQGIQTNLYAAYEGMCRALAAGEPIGLAPGL